MREARRRLGVVSVVMVTAILLAAPPALGSRLEVRDHRAGPELAGLSAEHRRALDIAGVAVTTTSVGMAVEVRFKERVKRALGHPDLRLAMVALVLEPASPDGPRTVLATSGEGHFGRTFRSSDAKFVAVRREGTKLTFFVFGECKDGVVAQALAPQCRPGPPPAARLAVASVVLPGRAVVPFADVRKLREATRDIAQNGLGGIRTADTLGLRPPAPSPESDCDDIGAQADLVFDWWSWWGERSRALGEHRSRLKQRLEALDPDQPRMVRDPDKLEAEVKSLKKRLAETEEELRSFAGAFSTLHPFVRGSGDELFGRSRKVCPTFPHEFRVSHARRAGGGYTVCMNFVAPGYHPGKARFRVTHFGLQPADKRAPTVVSGGDQIIALDPYGETKAYATVDRAGYYVMSVAVTAGTQRVRASVVRRVDGVGSSDCRR